MLCTGSVCGEVRVWSVPTSTCVGCFQAHCGATEALTFLDEGSMLLSGGSDHTVSQLCTVQTESEAEKLNLTLQGRVAGCPFFWRQSTQLKLNAGQVHLHFPFVTRHTEASFFSVSSCPSVKQLQLWSGGLGRSVTALKSDEVSSLLILSS